MDYHSFPFSFPLHLFAHCTAARPSHPCSNVHVMREQLERAEARARQAEEMLPDAAELQVWLGGGSVAADIASLVGAAACQHWAVPMQHIA